MADVKLQGPLVEVVSCPRCGRLVDLGKACPLDGHKVERPEESVLSLKISLWRRPEGTGGTNG